MLIRSLHKTDQSEEQSDRGAKANLARSGLSLSSGYEPSAQSELWSWRQPSTSPLKSSLESQL